MTNEADTQELLPPELLPCPFCGGEAYWSRAINGTMMAYVGCSPCGVSMKAQTHGYGDDIFPLSRDIIAAWNTRADLVPSTSPPAVDSQPVPQCNFCGKSDAPLIQATIGFICKSCVAICAEIVSQPVAAGEQENSGCACGHRYEQHGPWDYGSRCHVCACPKYSRTPSVSPEGSISSLNIDQAVARACKEPSLVTALSWIAVWESERVVQQARKNSQWETCFRVCFERVISAYPSVSPSQPAGDEEEIAREIVTASFGSMPDPNAPAGWRVKLTNRIAAALRAAKERT